MFAKLRQVFSRRKQPHNPTPKPGVKKVFEGTILLANYHVHPPIAPTTPAPLLIDAMNSAAEKFHGCMIEHGGEIETNLGGTGQVYFEGEGHAQRAYQSAIDLVEKLTQAELANGVHIGISSGEVTTGVITGANRTQHMLVGHPVQRSEQLEKVAKDHNANIVICETTQKLLNSNVALEKLGELENSDGTHTTYYCPAE